MSNHPENNNTTTPQEQVRNSPNLRYPLTEEDTPFPPLAAYPPLVPRPLAPRPHHPPPHFEEINLDEALRRMHDPRLAHLRRPTNPSWHREESIILARRDLRDREAQLQAIDDRYQPSSDDAAGADPDPSLEDMAEYEHIRAEIPELHHRIYRLQEQREDNNRAATRILDRLRGNGNGNGGFDGRRVGVAERFLEGLEVVPLRLLVGVGEWECCICKEEFAVGGGEVVVKVGCGHVFGKGCLGTWLGGGAKTCPMCRAVLI